MTRSVQLHWRLATILAVCSAVSSAQTISVNFSTNGSGGANALLAPADVAGVVPVANWNDASGIAGGPLALVDDTGAASGASVTWSALNSWGGSANPAPTDPDEAMMTSWLDDGDAGSNITVSSIPFSTYDLYLYGTSDAGNAGNGLSWEVNGNTFATNGVFADPLSGNGDFFFGTHVDGSTSADNPSYLKISSLTGDLNVIGDRSAGFRAAISGFQITEHLASPVPTITIDRDTPGSAGSLSLDNVGQLDAVIAGYSVLSDLGSLNGDNWTSIAGNYDGSPSGNGSVSPDEWFIFSSSPEDLSEGTLGTGTIAAGASVDLGTGVWNKYFEEDLVFEYLDAASGETLLGGVTFTGNGGQRFGEGDFNFDGNIDPLDWPTVRDNFNSSFPGASIVEAYHMGDLTRDLAVDLDDLLAFEVLYDAANGPGAFAKMVPEPGSLALLAIGALLFLCRRPRLALIVLMIGTLGTIERPAVADPIPIINHSFEAAALDGLPQTYSNCIDVECGQPDPDNWVDDPLNGADAFSEVIGGFAADGTHHLGIQRAGHRVRQVLTGETLMPNTLYTLNTAIGNRLGQTGAGNRSVFGLAVGGNNLSTLSSANASEVAVGTFADIGRYVYITGDSPQAGDLEVVLGVDSGDRAHYDNIRLDASPVASYTDLLNLDVNLNSGWVTLNNNLGFADLDIKYYEITSASGSLNLGGWNSLQDQNLPGFPSGNGTGNGWEELGNLDDTIVAEFFLQSSSVVSGGTGIPLGSLFDIAGTQDLRLFYHLENGQSLPGPVFYSASAVDGDFDGNGLWECTDINALVTAVATSSTDLSFDMNGDGVINASDITDSGSGWLAVGGAHNPSATGGNPFLVGDATLDGVVDGLDFIEWNGNKFTAVAEWCGGDFTADGIVDGLDFIEWNNNKFTSSDLAVAVPEPHCLTFILPMLFWGFKRRRRST